MCMVYILVVTFGMDIFVCIWVHKRRERDNFSFGEGDILDTWVILWLQIWGTACMHGECRVEL